MTAEQDQDLTTRPDESAPGDGAGGQYDYPPPVDRLLTLGEAQDPNGWPDYLALGLGPEHVPDLIRMVTDRRLYLADEDSAETWAPIHAWRTLGLLRAEAAVEPLLALEDEFAEDDNWLDWIAIEVPEVLGLIGPAAIPTLAAHLADESLDLSPRIRAVSSLERIGDLHPDARDEAVAILARQLAEFDTNHPELNGFLVDALAELEAIETAEVIERAFAAERVDEILPGDWDEVQVRLGLKEPDESAWPPLELAEDEDWPDASTSPTGLDLYDGERPPGSTSPTKAKAKAKSRRKMAKKSRRENRKRK